MGVHEHRGNGRRGMCNAVEFTRRYVVLLTNRPMVTWISVYTSRRVRNDDDRAYIVFYIIVTCIRCTVAVGVETSCPEQNKIRVEFIWIRDKN